jgi:hypothetical protein
MDDSTDLIDLRVARAPAGYLAISVNYGRGH